MVAQLLPESQGVPTFLGAGMTVAVVAYPFLWVSGILKKDKKEQLLVRSCNEMLKKRV